VFGSFHGGAVEKFKMVVLLPEISFNVVICSSFTVEDTEFTEHQKHSRG
jgi:hypothetical protein